MINIYFWNVFLTKLPAHDHYILTQILLVVFDLAQNFHRRTKQAFWNRQELAASFGTFRICLHLKALNRICVAFEQAISSNRLFSIAHFQYPTETGKCAPKIQSAKRRFLVALNINFVDFRRRTTEMCLRRTLTRIQLQNPPPKCWS